MQREISDKTKIGDPDTPFKSMGKSPPIDKTAQDFGNENLKVKKKLEDLCMNRCKHSSMQTQLNADIAQYIPGTQDLVFHGMIEKIMTIEQPVDPSYKDKEVLGFELILDNNF